MTLHVTTDDDWLAALCVLRDWGADEALLEVPQNRFSDVGVQTALPGSTPSRSAPGRRGQGSGAHPLPHEPSRVERSRHRAPEERETTRTVPKPALSEAPSAELAFLARMATHRVEPILVPHAPAMIISEAPDAEEDRTGHLFAGEIGVLLDKMLMSIGLTRASFSMVPAIPWRPPGGRAVSAIEMRAGLPCLQKIIGEARPTRLITLGLTPLRMLCGETTTFGQRRGKWCQVSIPGCLNPVALLPMRHPSQLKASPAVRRTSWHDLLTLRAHLEQDDSA